MSVRTRIATKIFGLAVFLLALTVFLSFFGLWQARQLKKDLDSIAARDVPLDDFVDNLERHGLERRLEFEKQLEKLDDAVPDTAAIEAAKAKYASLNQDVARDLSDASALVKRALAAGSDAVELAGIAELLEEVQRDDAVVADVETRTLDHQAHRRTDRVTEFLEIREKLQSSAQARRDELASRIDALTHQTAQLAEARERTLVRVTVAATTSAVLLGLVLAWMMSRRIVRPVESLMGGVHSVEHGDLTTQVPVQSDDEIGVLTVAFNKLVDELRSKERLKETFGKYIDPRIVENVILNPSSAETQGGRRVMTVSFCDLVGFTGIGEHLTPTALVRLLNRHFVLMAEAIHEHQGVLDKFIGDAVMSFWGPPFTTSAEHAVLACQTALAQIRLMQTLRAEVPEITGLRKEMPAVDVRVGLASGEMVIGNIGAETARSYTVIGDTVNVASRLESVNRIYGTKVLMNPEACQLAGTAVETREIDWVAVKGKTEPVAAHELLGMAGEVAPRVLSLRERYEEGLAAYRKFDWAAAETALRGALEIDEQDRPSQVLLERVAAFRSAPPAEDWDGVWRLAEK